MTISSTSNGPENRVRAFSDAIGPATPKEIKDAEKTLGMKPGNPAWKVAKPSTSGTQGAKTTGDAHKVTDNVAASEKPASKEKQWVGERFASRLKMHGKTVGWLLGGIYIKYVKETYDNANDKGALARETLKDVTKNLKTNQKNIKTQQVARKTAIKTAEEELKEPEMIKAAKQLAEAEKTHAKNEEKLKLASANLQGPMNKRKGQLKEAIEKLKNTQKADPKNFTQDANLQELKTELTSLENFELAHKFEYMFEEAIEKIEASKGSKTELEAAKLDWLKAKLDTLKSRGNIDNNKSYTDLTEKRNKLQKAQSKTNINKLQSQKQNLQKKVIKAELKNVGKNIETGLKVAGATVGSVVAFTLITPAIVFCLPVIGIAVLADAGSHFYDGKGGFMPYADRAKADLSKAEDIKEESMANADRKRPDLAKAEDIKEESMANADRKRPDLAKAENSKRTEWTAKLTKEDGLYYLALTALMSMRPTQPVSIDGLMSRMDYDKEKIEDLIPVMKKLEDEGLLERRRDADGSERVPLTINKSKVENRYRKFLE